MLVTPIDGSAPKGRMILPQVQTIRDILDANAVCITVQPDQLLFALESLKVNPKLTVFYFEFQGKFQDFALRFHSYRLLLFRNL